jgi:hypothetical protein
MGENLTRFVSMLKSVDIAAKMRVVLNMFNAMSKPIRSVSNGLKSMIHSLRSMSKTLRNMQKLTDISRKLGEAIKSRSKGKKSAKKEDCEEKKEDCKEECKESGKQSNQGDKGSKKWADGLMKAIQKWSVQGLRALIQSTDQFVATQSRLSFIVDEGQTVTELSDMDRGLATYNIEGIFPNHYWKGEGSQVYPPYLAGFEVLRPMRYVEYIMKWWETKRPIRFIFVGGNAYVGGDGHTVAEINTPASIEGFEWKEVAGSPGDIQYALQLKEYRFYAARKVQPTGAAQTAAQTRPDDRVPPRTYTLVAGDNLWKVAQKVLGDGSRWREIQRLNGITDAQIRSLPVGMVLKLPDAGGGAGA